jgi:hypothetical protein
MIFRNLDSGGDWTFGAGKQNFASQNKAIGLNIKTRILSWVGDCFFDQPAGIDWLNRLGNKNQRTLLELDLRRIIMGSEGVTEIVSFDTILNDRNFTGDYSVNTIYSKAFADTFAVKV